MIKRITCTDCLRPEKTCVCKFAQPVKNKIPVVILQHPDEMTHAKNTGRLLHLCLTNSQIFVGELFAWNHLNSQRHENTTAPFFDVLLYPDKTDYSSLNIQPPPQFDWTQPDLDEYLNNHPPRLWIIDATWRKSRKMLYQNQFLQSMPLLPLTTKEPGRYFIRKATDKNQLSTFEATCYALQQLESQSQFSKSHATNYDPAFTAFTEFLQEQAKLFKF